MFLGIVLMLLPVIGQSYVLDVDNSNSLVITVDPEPVLVELYYESLCPGCRQFITSMLGPTWDLMRDTGTMQVAVYPYGNADQTQNPDGSWKFICQHGDKECLGNKLEVCAMRHLDWDSRAYLTVITCMEQGRDPVKEAKNCIEKHTTLNYEDIETCAKGAEGNKLEHAMGVKTESLDPAHDYVPWVVINGEHNNELETEAMRDLRGLVCRLYMGQRPSQCDDTNA